MEKLTATAFLVQSYETNREDNYLGYYEKKKKKQKRKKREKSKKRQKKKASLDFQDMI